MVKNIFIPIILCFFIGDLLAQSNFPLSVDSLSSNIEEISKKKKKKPIKQFFKKDYPSPKKAVLLAIFPGMGQIYNKKFWKLPLVYGALGGVIYAIDYNTKQYNTYNTSLAIRNQTATGTDPVNSVISDAAVQSLRNNFDKNRQLSWIGLIGFYLISAGDALVDAHLKDFNVDDNISFVPTIETNYNNQPILGIGVRIALVK